MAVLCRFKEEGAALIGNIRIRPQTNLNAGTLRSPSVLLCLWCIVIACILLLLNFDVLFLSETARIGLGAAVGGASSNLLDRLTGEGVVDYIDLGFLRIFNLADVAIIGGVLITLCFIS